MSNPHDDAIAAKMAAETAERNLRAAVQNIDELRARIDQLEQAVATLAEAVTGNGQGLQTALQLFAGLETRVSAVDAFRSDIERWREQEEHDGALR